MPLGLGVVRLTLPARFLIANAVVTHLGAVVRVAVLVDDAAPDDPPAPPSDVHHPADLAQGTIVDLAVLADPVLAQ